MGAFQLSKAKAKSFKALSSKKERDLKGLFLAEGEKCVEDMLGFFELQNLVITKSYLERKFELLKDYMDLILETDRHGMEMISSLNTVPNVVAVFKKPKDSTETPILEKNSLYLLLDEIQDPGNLGTIIRTCDWFGVYEIFASPTTVDVYNPKVVQATMGSLSRVKVRYIDLCKLIENNKEMTVMGTLLEGRDLNTISSNCKGFLIMGNEGKGISNELLRKIQMPITILPKNPVSHPDSLNVAIATAICLSKLS
ncbi:MAG: RNA methyltransferase [Muribaculaceae bacterium]|nr:RNA methyltransferase [Muribaculaceae bacterium]